VYNGSEVPFTVLLYIISEIFVVAVVAMYVLPNACIDIGTLPYVAFSIFAIIDNVDVPNFEHLWSHILVAYSRLAKQALDMRQPLVRVL
jgi:hypothetical protein